MKLNVILETHGGVRIKEASADQHINFILSHEEFVDFWRTLGSCVEPSALNKIKYLEAEKLGCYDCFLLQE